MLRLGIFGEFEAHGNADGTGGDRAKEMRAEISARLNGEIKADPHLEPTDLASLLKSEPKTLAHDRSNKNGLRWPRPFRMAGGSKILYARSHAIDRLAVTSTRLLKQPESAGQA